MIKMTDVWAKSNPWVEETLKTQMSTFTQRQGKTIKMMALVQLEHTIFINAILLKICHNFASNITSKQSIKKKTIDNQLVGSENPPACSPTCKDVYLGTNS